MQYIVGTNKNQATECVTTKPKGSVRTFMLKCMKVETKTHAARNSKAKPGKKLSVLKVLPLTFDLYVSWLKAHPSLIKLTGLIFAATINAITKVRTVMTSAIDGAIMLAKNSATPHETTEVRKNFRFHLLPSESNALTNVFAFVVEQGAFAFSKADFSFKSIFAKSFIILSKPLKSSILMIAKIPYFFKKIVHLTGIILLFVYTERSAQASDITLSNAQKKGYIKNLMNEAEKQYEIPSGILMAIAKVESNVKLYSLNINGKPRIASTQNEAIQIAKQSIKSGISNVDIGIMQLNYYWHGKEFENIEDMIKPEKNIAYAASYLKSLKDQHGSWRKAIRYYHSAKRELNGKYSKKVILTWLKRDRNSLNEAENV